MATAVDAPARVNPKPGALRRALDVIDDRLGLTALQYPVPEHANNLAWSLGGLTATALLVLIATGIILTQFFNPIPEEANASVRRIVEDVPLGELVRGVHFWAAQAMYVLAGTHLLRVFLTGSYKRPREANWLIGVAMFALVIGAIFTGTVIKWDQEGFEALAHNLEVGRLVGGAGFWFSAEFSADLPLIVRLYVAHVAIIPGLILALLAVHFLLVKRHGISPHPSLPDAPAEPREPFTHHLRRLGAFGLALIGGLVIAATLFPPVIGPTPVEGIEVTRPVWMFWWLFTLENWWGVNAILWGTVVLFALLVSVPFVDRRTERRWTKRPLALSLAAAALLVMVILTYVTATTSAVEHL
jgi:ubiquinol-cytochrome c reductase cytochrome b subunit